MKQLKKLTAIALLVAMLLSCFTAFAEMKETEAVEAYFYTDIDEAGAALSLTLTQEQSDEAFMTLYENEDIMLGGRDGVVVDINFFSDDYTLYGVTIGMTVDEAKVVLDEQNITYRDDNIVELGEPMLVFDVPGHEEATGSFEINDGLIAQASLYTMIDAEEEEEEVPEATAAPVSKKVGPVEQTGYIKMTGDAHLRSKADKESTSLGTVSKNTKLKYTAYAKDSRAVVWYKVKTNGKNGWVSSMYAKKITKKEYEKKQDKPKEKKASGTIQLTGRANVRKSPDKGSKSLDVFAKDSVLKYTATAKDERGVTWYKVSADGVTGWISSKNAKIYKSGSGKTKEKKASGYIKLTGRVNVRKSPDKDSKSLEVFAKGSVLKYTATAKDSRGVTWYKVSADGITGWISEKNAKKTK